jgi:hypothetical protein
MNMTGAIALSELGQHRITGARHLNRHAFALARIFLDQTFCGLSQKPQLLFDQQQIARTIDDHEVDFAEDGVTSVEGAPVNPVIDGVVIRQRRERLCRVSSSR